MNIREQDIQTLGNINKSLDHMAPGCEWDNLDCQCDWETLQRRERYQALLCVAANIERKLGL